MSDFAQSLAGKEPKAAVNEFCQRHCARPRMTKQDVVYTTLQHGSSYQTTLKLNCIEGQEFTGELAPTQKDAEKSAAQQVLVAFAEQISFMPAKAAAGKTKQLAIDASGEPATKMPRLEGATAAGGGDLQTKDSKTLLNQLLQKHCARTVTKQDVVYTTLQIESSYQAAVKLNCIEGQEFLGELAPTPKDAEKSAAQQALDAFSLEIGSITATASKKTKPASDASREPATKMPRLEGATAVRGGDLQNKDSKTLLNQFLQKHCARTVTKQDAVYTTLQLGSWYQTTLKLNCIEGREFLGELSPTAKDAEKSAAQQALDAFSLEIGSITATPSKTTKPASDASGVPTTNMPWLEGATAVRGGDLQNKDSKTLLNQFLQKRCARTITKQDAVYTTLQLGSSYQTTLKLNCIEGREFLGELAPTAKGAEKSAAQQVLDAFSLEIGSMAATAGKKKQPASNTNRDAKTTVNQFCQKHCARAMTKQDVVYTTVQYGNQFQTTLTLNCIEGQEYAGELAATQKEAEQSAAQQVLGAFSVPFNSLRASMAEPSPRVWLSLGPRGL